MTLKRLLFVACFNQFIHWFIFGLIFPILTLFQLARGLNLFQAGVTYAVFYASSIILDLPTGGLADAIGRKKVYLISLIFWVLFGLTFLFAHGFEMMILGSVFLGIGRALSSGCIDAWFVDQFYIVEPGGNLQPALAKFEIFAAIGIGVGSLLGGYLPVSLGRIAAQIQGLDIYSPNLIALCALVVIQFFLTIILLHESPRFGTNSNVPPGFRQFPQMIGTSIHYGVKHRILFMLLLATLGWGLAIAGLELLWQPQVKIFLGSESQTWIFGLLATGYFLSSALGNILITPICKVFKNNHRLVLIGARLFMAVLFFLLAIQHNLPGFTAFYWLFFLVNGLSNSPHKAIFNSQIPSEKRSTLLSFNSFVSQIGSLFGSLIMGFVSNMISIPVAWFFGAGVLFISGFAYFFISDRSR